ncbi:MAG: efflux RND transporter periplasmic adaptor subunit, partial [Verrucomicrobia bacterium]|nr:efflux RND transporter periplasmic adaptor subunit [Verrucomicrobiota bacterium]
MNRLAVLLSASGLLLAGCHKSESAATAANLPPARVHVATAQTAERPALTEVTGTVRPVLRAQIAAKVMGAITELPVTLGQRVAAGDLLVRISVGEITARVAQAQAQLNVARRDLERERDLLGKGASTAEMVRSLEDRFTMTQAMVREAEVMLSYAEVRAPFAGVVARKLANVGDLAAPGYPLVELEGTDNFQVEVPVPDSLVSRLAPGATLEVTIPAADLKVSTTLAELSSAADPSARTVLAKLALPAGAAVRSGQYARVLVPGAPVASLLIPAAALAPLGQMERIFVVGPGNR